MSSLLFNRVLQAALEDDLAQWREKGMGFSLGDLQADSLSNLRFADDVILFSASLKQSNRRKEVTINNIKVEVLPMKQRPRYLGQTKTFEQQETTEITSRIRTASLQIDNYNDLPLLRLTDSKSRHRRIKKQKSL